MTKLVFIPNILMATILLSMACSRSKPAPIEVEQRPAKLPTAQSDDRPGRPSSNRPGREENDDGTALNGNQAAGSGRETSQHDLPQLPSPIANDTDTGSSSTAGSTSAAGSGISTGATPFSTGPAGSSAGTQPPAVGSNPSSSTPSVNRWDGIADRVEDSSLMLAP